MNWKPHVPIQEGPAMGSSFCLILNIQQGCSFPVTWGLGLARSLTQVFVVFFSLVREGLSLGAFFLTVSNVRGIIPYFHSNVRG
jgi:hypothetical protein